LGDQVTNQPSATDQLRFDESSFAAALEAAGMMGGFGDQDALASVWGSTLPDERIVEHRTTTRPRPRESGPLLSNRGVGRGVYARGDITERNPVKTKDLLKDFVLRSRQDVGGYTEQQQLLFMAGFYDPRATMEDIQFGTMDDLTLDAYYNLLTWTARYNESGADITSDQLLQERAATMLGPLREAMAKKAAGGGGGGRTIVLSDSAGLAQGLDSVAQNVLGRKANADEQRMFIALIHGMEGGGQNPDPGARAEAMLREQAPVEAGAHDVARVFDDFLGIIGGMGTT
jgi:hypothetical protein